jgi:hypothetical protein
MIGVITMNAQNLTFDNISKVYLRSIGSILNGKEISGYYYLYKLENQDKKMALFKLIITDANLNKVAEKDIIDHKSTTINGISFNGQNLAVKTLALDKEPISTIRLYDLQSNEIKKVSAPFEEKAYTMINLMNSGGEVENSELQPLPGIGFLNFTPFMSDGKKGNIKMGDRIGTIINMVSPNANAKTWKYQTLSTKFEIPTYIGSNNEVSFVSILRKNDLKDRDFEFPIIGINHNTGKVNFDKIFTDKDHILSVSNYVFMSETNENLFFGSLLEKDAKAKKAKVEGMFISKIDDNGKIIFKQDILWSEFGKQFNIKDEKGNEEEIGNIYIHKMLTTKDGKIFAIGERYHKAASGAGIAAAILGGGGPGFVKAVLEEIVIIEFNKDFKPIKLNTFPKGKSNVQLPPGAGLMGESLFGIILKSINGFDYSYTQETDDKSSFTVGYFFREDKINYFGAINYADGKFTKDKISLKTESTSLRVFPAKPGYIMINEYFKKLKKSESRLEKLNF